MKYGDYCWVDIEQADKDKIVVLPLSSMEQHGHHAPLLTDTYLVSAVADGVEERLRDEIYMLPPLWLGASDHHLDKPGTVSVPNNIYTLMIKNIVRSFAKAGFKRVFLLNGHGGNTIPGTQAIKELTDESDVYDKMWIAMASYWTIAGPAMAPERHGMESKQLSHACEYETSMMLFLNGDIVRMDRVTASPPLIDSPYYHSQHGGRLNVSKRITTWAPTGAMGSPQHATAEKGRSLLEAIVDEVVKCLEDFATW